MMTEEKIIYYLEKHKIEEQDEELRRTIQLKQVELSKEEIEKQLLEELSELEHEQWMHWRKYIEDKHSIKHSRWMIPYNDLPEKIKEQDRVWARKVVGLLLKKLEMILNQKRQFDEMENN